MTRGDDLTPFMMGGGQPDFGFHSGIVLVWNVDTGANVIEVAGTPLTDLPILNTGEAIALKAGHVVGLLRFKHTYFVLGRVTVPGDPNFASATVAFASARDFQNNFAVTTTIPGAARATAVMNVPAWADEALVTAFADGTGNNTTGAVDFLGVYARIQSGAVNLAGQENFDTVPAGQLGTASASVVTVITDPGSTITVSVGMRSANSNWAASVNTLAAINATAVFRSTV